MYEKIFPLGDASKYAHLVFRAIDRDRTGGITFGDFMEFLSVISKGTEEEKMMWSFQFYDVNQDGTISRDEMLKVKKNEIIKVEMDEMLKVKRNEMLKVKMDEMFRIKMDEMLNVKRNEMLKVKMDERYSR